MRAALFVALAGGCAARGVPLLVLQEDVVLQPAVRAKIGQTPHNYFRFVNREFSREVCARFGDALETMPLVNLHGDAHLEQYAVTAHSAGLADFDDSVMGPPVLDLVRFGTSIVLALEERGWADHTEEVLDRFFESYRAALGGARPPPQPAVVERLRANFPTSPVEFLAWADTLMLPVPEAEEAEILARYGRYAQAMRSLHPDTPVSTFTLKRWGALHSGGIGSTRGMRVLARIEGGTPDDIDDIILEAKAVRDLSDVPCVHSQRGDALRVIDGSVRFGGRPDPYLAVVPRGADEDDDDPPWWIQSWSATYGDLDIETSFRAVEEVGEVVASVGAQLGAGHTSRLPSPPKAQMAESLQAVLDAQEAPLRAASAILAAEIRVAHQRFRSGR